ncbi:hypothetical protein YC2023_095913 [Brassica napus]
MAVKTLEDHYCISVLSMFLVSKFFSTFFIADQCVNSDKDHYSGTFKETVHVVAGSHFARGAATAKWMTPSTSLEMFWLALMIIDSCVPTTSAS